MFKSPRFMGEPTRAQALGLSAIQQGHRLIYREAHVLLDELAGATLERRCKQVMTELATAPLLIVDDLGMRKLPMIAAEDLLELIMRRYERAARGRARHRCASLVTASAFARSTNAGDKSRKNSRAQISLGLWQNRHTQWGTWSCQK